METLLAGAFERDDLRVSPWIAISSQVHGAEGLPAPFCKSASVQDSFGLQESLGVRKSPEHRQPLPRKLPQYMRGQERLLENDRQVSWLLSHTCAHMYMQTCDHACFGIYLAFVSTYTSTGVHGRIPRYAELDMLKYLDLAKQLHLKPRILAVPWPATL